MAEDKRMTVEELVELLRTLNQAAKVSVVNIDDFGYVRHVPPSVTEMADGSYLL